MCICVPEREKSLLFVPFPFVSFHIFRRLFCWSSFGDERRKGGKEKVLLVSIVIHSRHRQPMSRPTDKLCVHARVTKIRPSQSESQREPGSRNGERNPVSQNEEQQQNPTTTQCPYQYIPFSFQRASLPLSVPRFLFSPIQLSSLLSNSMVSYITT